MPNSLPTLRFVRINGELTLRVTANGEIENDYRVPLRDAVLLIAEASLFVRDRIPEIELTTKANQQPKEQTNGTQA